METTSINPGVKFSSAHDPTKEYRLLLAFFGESRLPQCTRVEPEDIPEPCKSLLVHEEHMTVTLEAHFGSKVNVLPFQIHRQGDLYGRQLELWSSKSSELVMTGIMIINLRCCTEKVAAKIVEGRTPLGRILIENNVLRRVSTESFLKIAPTDPLAQRFPAKKPAFGRIATIFYNDRPAVDLLEIVAQTTANE